MQPSGQQIDPAGNSAGNSASNSAGNPVNSDKFTRTTVWPHLVVVCWHPRQQYEGPPVVAEVTEDDRPHLLAAQQLAPRDTASCFA